MAKAPLRPTITTQDDPVLIDANTFVDLQERKRLFELFAAMYPMTQVLDIGLINRRVSQVLEEYSKWK